MTPITHDHDDPRGARSRNPGGGPGERAGGAALRHVTSPDEVGSRSLSIKAITYALIGLSSLTAATISIWLAVGNFRAGDVAGGMGVLAYLPMYTAGMSAAGEQFLRGDGSRTALQMLPLLLIGIILSAFSHIVL